MDKRAALQKLYGSERWRKRSKHQLRREPWCRFCLVRGEVTVATVADHIFPHHGDVNQFWCGALQSLCRPCHDGGKKFAENRGFDRAIDAVGSAPSGLRRTSAGEAGRPAGRSGRRAD